MFCAPGTTFTFSGLRSMFSVAASAPFMSFGLMCVPAGASRVASTPFTFFGLRWALPDAQALAPGGLRSLDLTPCLAAVR